MNTNARSYSLRFYKQGGLSYYRIRRMPGVQVSSIKSYGWLVDETLARLYCTFFGWMERMGKKKKISAPLEDIRDPFTYNYHQHLTNFDVLKVYIYRYSYIHIILRDLRVD